MDGPLTIDEIRMVVEAVTEVFQNNPETRNEPIPPFATHDPAKLQAALNAPFQSAFREDIYKTVYEKAAALFYFMAKDHPFENGNKRIAVLTLLYYLARNGLAVEVSARALYETAVAVVESPRTKDELVPGFAAVLEKISVPLEFWLKEALKRAVKPKK